MNVRTPTGEIVPGGEIVSDSLPYRLVRLPSRWLPNAALDWPYPLTLILSGLLIAGVAYLLFIGVRSLWR